MTKKVADLSATFLIFVVPTLKKIPHHMTDEQLVDLVLTPGVKEQVIEFLTRKKLTHELRISVKEFSETVVAIRKIFNSCRHRQAGGPMSRLRTKLEWFMSVTDFSVQEILDACQKYIDECNQKQRYPFDAHNFVVNQEGGRRKELNQSELFNYLTNYNEPAPTTFTEQI